MESASRLRGDEHTIRRVRATFPEVPVHLFSDGHETSLPT